MLNKSLILVAVLFFCSLGHTVAQFKVVGYLPTYRFTHQVDYSALTHLNLSFARTDASGELSFSTSISGIVGLAHDKGVKVLASIGGAGVSATESSYYSNLQQPQNVAGFVSKIKRFLIDNNLDGIDVDLEGNNIGPNYELFVTTLADSLKPEGLLVTAALAMWNGDEISNAAAQAFDFINMMAYDATGPWNPGNEGQHSSYDFALSHINYWNLDRGISKNNLVLGVPFYGYEFDNGGPVTSWTYASILSSFSGQDPASKDQIGSLYYNGAETIEEKTELAIAKTSGVMIWELGQDASGDASLLRVIGTAAGTVGLDEDIAAQFELAVFPNPTTEQLNMRWATQGRRSWHITVVDAQGVSISNEVQPFLQGQTGEAVIPTNSWNPGLYHVLLTSERETISSTVFKK